MYMIWKRPPFRRVNGLTYVQQSPQEAMATSSLET